MATSIVSWDSLGVGGRIQELGRIRAALRLARYCSQEPVQVNTHTISEQFIPAVAADDGGAFVDRLAELPATAAAAGIFGRRFSSAGAPLAVEFQVASAHRACSRYARRSTSTSGGDVRGGMGPTALATVASYGVFARRFDASGAASSADFQVNSYTARRAAPPLGGARRRRWLRRRLAELAAGRHSAIGIFAAVSPPLAALDVDGNGAARRRSPTGCSSCATTSASPARPLATGAIGASCSRCDRHRDHQLPHRRSALRARHRRQRRPRPARPTDCSRCATSSASPGRRLTTNAVGQPCSRCDAARSCRISTI